ncbi:acyl-CoA dehydrogenase family protein [Ferrovibrio xuzhouensis]|uniref:Acyl-CoA dehydrogenase family protein n=1 Tax=Ferrovibrio xuzhouensis TaxID=1576914 RepID=A0ABV7VCK6_9PROT
MNFDLPPEIAEIQSVTSNLVRSLLRYEPKFHETGEVDPDVNRQLLDLGFYALPFPEEFGGSNLGALAKVVVQAELAHLPPQFWAEMRALHGPASKTLVRHGSVAQKQHWLPAMIRGECPVAFALTEADGGSDVSAIKTRAVRDGDGWILSGRKMFISNAHKAKLITVYAYTDRAAGIRNGLSAFLVDTATPGFRITRNIKLMGTASPGVAELEFDDCRLPADSLLGEEGKAFGYAMECLNEGRLTVGANAVGMGAKALEEAISFARQRQAFGKPIAGFQAIQHMLADMSVDIHAARQMLLDAAWRYDEGKVSVELCSMVKLFCSEAGGRVVDKGLQIFGGTGYCTGTVIERLYRDVRVTRIYEGSSEIQRNLIAKKLLQ